VRPSSEAPSVTASVSASSQTPTAVTPPASVGHEDRPGGESGASGSRPGPRRRGHSARRRVVVNPDLSQCCCLGVVGDTDYKCLTRGLDFAGHCGADCTQRPACIEEHAAAAVAAFRGDLRRAAGLPTRSNDGGEG
jgi:hypothetical protein